MVMCEAESAGFSAAPDFSLGMAPWSDVSSAGRNKRATSPVPVPDFNAQSASPRLLDSVVQAVLACWETKPSAHHHHDLSDFVAFVVRQMDIGEAVLQVAMAYMFRLKRKFDENAIGTENCSAQLFTVCVMTATKFLIDIPYSNAQWADATQLDRKHLNLMELELLDALQYEMNVSTEERGLVQACLDQYLEHPLPSALQARVEIAQATTPVASSAYATVTPLAVVSAPLVSLPTIGQRLYELQQEQAAYDSHVPTSAGMDDGFSFFQFAPTPPSPLSPAAAYGDPMLALGSASFFSDAGYPAPNPYTYDMRHVYGMNVHYQAPAFANAHCVPYASWVPPPPQFSFFAHAAY